MKIPSLPSPSRSLAHAARPFAPRDFLQPLIAGLAIWCLAEGCGLAATTNQWTNSISGSWNDVTNWSMAQLPSTSFDVVMIGDAGTKTVALDGTTASGNRSVRSLIVGAPPGSTNTLVMTDLVSPAFTTSKPFIVDRGGVVLVTNSSLTLGDRLDVSGSFILDSGLVDTTPGLWDVRVGRVPGLTGSVMLNGGMLSCFGFRVGEFANAQGSCTLDGGTLLSSSVVSLGEVLNAPGTMTILSGQLIATNDITKVGNLAFGHYSQSGGSAEMAFLSIGDNMPGTLDISGGNLTVTPAAPLDITRVGNFGTAQLNISGGTVWFRGQFDVADNPGIIGNVMMTGGRLISTNDLVAIGRYGLGQMTVSNATAWFTNTSVGRHTGAEGTLIVQTGGAVYCLDALSIGRFTNGIGHVTVFDGLLSLTNDRIWVGREGLGDLAVSGGTVHAQGMFVGMSEDGINTPQGTVTISGGVTVLSSNLLVGTSLLSTGHVSVVGGLLAVTNAGGTGMVDVVSGTFTLNQGTVMADRLTLTNGPGQFSFPAGTLRVQGMTVSNGAPFVVGDGLHAATLQLDGGTYSFADGLVIASNATVSGCGTILGVISNNGILSTNCGGSVSITSFGHSGQVTIVSFSTLAGSNHVLEYKNALSDPAWTAILPGIIGAGGTTNLQDTTATNAQRFYRIHLQ